MTSPRLAKCISSGHALCTPSGGLLPFSFRTTEPEAIATMFSNEDWPSRQSEGWSAEFVYARIFTPKFFVDVVPEKEGA